MPQHNDSDPDFREGPEQLTVQLWAGSPAAETAGAVKRPTLRA